MKPMKHLLAILLLIATHGAWAAETDDLLAKANAGDAGAQYDLGLKYTKGDGVSKDVKEAVKWLVKSAEQGNADAQLSLGSLYIGGREVPKNSTESAKWFLLAAEQGRAAAQLQMSRMYLAGAGVVKDYVQASKWAAIAMVQGDKQASQILGFLKTRMTAEQTAEAETLVREFVEKKASDNAAHGIPLVAPPLE
jgi:uncharacterized protein